MKSLQAIIATEDRRKHCQTDSTISVISIQHVKPELNGDDLIRPWRATRSKRIGELLNELLELRIERSISNAEEEREHVMRRLSDG